MIIGRFGDTTGRPYVEGRFFLPRQGISGNISFLVDTGADASVIMPTDGVRLGIDYGRFTETSQTTGVGGSALSYREVAILAFFERNRRKLQLYSLDVFFIQARPESHSLPSLLGRDILDRWHMTYDPPRARLRFTVRSADQTVSVP